MALFGNCVSSCWNTMTCSGTTNQQQERDDRRRDDNVDNFDDHDPLVWSRDLVRHSCGEFSYAAVPGKLENEDYSQVEIGSNALFVGIYDGHDGPHAARFANGNLFNHLIGIARNHGTISEQTLAEAISATDEGFLNLVQTTQEEEPMAAVSGSSCLILVIWKGTLLTAHLGESYAVNGILTETRIRETLQMMVEHNVNTFCVREQVLNSHRDDPNIVVKRDGDWRIKDITQISRAIGDAYLKRSEFRAHPSLVNFQFPGPLARPAISTVPDLYSRALRSIDRFFIIASHGFWQHLKNAEAAEIVRNNPRRGIARRLLKAAQVEAAVKAETNYMDLCHVSKANRGTIHDDMTVVVVFIDHEFVGQKNTHLPQMSIKGFTNAAEQSNFRDIDHLM